MRARSWFETLTVSVRSPVATDRSHCVAGAVVSLRGVTFWYPGAREDAPALAALDLTVGDGEFVLLCGPSGSGKSTLLRLCLGLAPQFTGGRLAGEADVLGRDPTATPPHSMAAEGVGLLLQNPTEGFVAQRVDAEVAFGLENLGLPASEIDGRIAESLAAVGLAGLERRRTRDLSAGQQQRVALAAALALRPRLILLDEPTAHLDMASARDALTLIARVRAEAGAALVLSEHRLGLAAPLADRAVVLAVGRKIADGPPREVFRDASLPGVGVPVPRATRVAVALNLPPPLPLTPDELAARVVSLPVPGAEGGSELPLLGERAGVRGPSSPAGLTPERPEHPSPGSLRSPASPPGEAALSPSPALKRSGGPLIRGGGQAPSTTTEERAGARGPSQEPVLSFEQVSFAYPGAQAPALEDVTFSLAAGEVAGLVGPSGAGKSTLARLALGLLRPNGGRVELAGFDTSRTPLSQLARLGGLVLQNPLHQLLTERVLDELRLGLRDLPAGEAAARVESLLETFGLQNLRDRHPLALSEGQRRRVALAATLVRRPQVLVLDEPTLGQDEGQRIALQDLARALAADGAAVLAISHDPEFVNDACDRVLRLAAGCLMADFNMVDACANPERLEGAGVPLGDVPASALALQRMGRPVRARFLPDLVAVLEA